ncbi:hypothetical protein [Microbacterium sp. Leaf320]|uniref:hypothetical protein n=1 Tax=Microbacterium sp. Leaf320 TaxID=1736334 RepID=UPI0012F97F21|nr:hypothetical protein [Microbacterium sp. Leaf320]
MSETESGMIEEAAKAMLAVDHPNVEWWGVADIVKSRWLEKARVALAIYRKHVGPDAAS